MGLIAELPKAVFDTSAVCPGNVMYGKHFSWNEGISGVVTSVTESRITVQYHPGIGNVTNHFFIPVEEATAGDWQIRWSADLSEVQEYNIPHEEPEPVEPDKPAGDEEKAEEGSNDI